MDSKSLKELRDLFGHNLDGWKISTCYFLELKHELMGTFPAITVDKKQEVVVSDKNLLRQVWAHIDKRPARVRSFTAIIHEKDGIAFMLDSTAINDAEPLHCFSEKEIEKLCRKTHPFKWMPGLINLSRGPINISFPV